MSVTLGFVLRYDHAPVSVVQPQAQPVQPVIDVRPMGLSDRPLEPVASAVRPAVSRPRDQASFMAPLTYSASGQTGKSQAQPGSFLDIYA